MGTFSPAAKIFLYILLIIAVFFTHSFKIYLGILGLVVLFAVRVPFRSLKRGFVPVTFFLCFTFFSNALLQKGRIVYEVFGITLTEEGIRNGGYLTLRLFILILGAKILSAATSAEELVRGINSILGPFGKFTPVREFMNTMLLSLRFLPIIYDEANTLYRRAFKDSKDTTLINKIRLSASMLAPVFHRSINRARDLTKI